MYDGRDSETRLFVGSVEKMKRNKEYNGAKS